MKIFDNNVKSFDEKLNKVTQSIGNIVDFKPSFNLSQKFLLPEDLNVEEAIPPVIKRSTYQETVDYLVSDNSNKKSSVYLIQRRNKFNKFLFSHNTRHLSKNLGDRRDIQRKITKEVYKLFKNQKDNKKKTLYKRLTSFSYYNQGFLIEEHFKNSDFKDRYWSILRFDTHECDKDQEKVLPRFLEIGENVTLNYKYYSFHMADIK